MASLLDDPSYWRACAKEARSVAALMTDPSARKTLLSIAESYDALAKHAEKRLADQLRQGHQGQQGQGSKAQQGQQAVPPPSP
jgi:hypothetical protein